MKKKIAQILPVMIAAVVILVIGNMSRTYAAFGGEDVLFIAAVIWSAVKLLGRRADER